ncbi:hypothetical protein MSAN_01228000 [Mycena sanguinolenta]|uniref:Uncharacterized protein n=1 Tax=Mycena sanguinolenta TaxID=230812 RepID=A0A8H6YD49_9AGAR|nr:hypothetical protein MSAN_01228000 [Mycena sanguinolenta]
MSSATIRPAPTIRNFQSTFQILPRDNNDAEHVASSSQQVISLGIIVSSGGEIHLDLRSAARSEESSLGQSVVIDIFFQNDDGRLEEGPSRTPGSVSLSEATAVNDASSSNSQRTLDSSVAAPTSDSPPRTTPMPPLYTNHGSPNPSTPQLPLTSNASLLIAQNVSNDEPLPAYSRFPPVASVQVQEPLPELLLDTPGSGTFQQQQQQRARDFHASPRPFVGDMYGRNQRREILMLDDDSEERLELPIDRCGSRRQRKLCWEDEEDDEEEARYAKRSRDESWGPIRFLRSLWI